MNFPRRMRAGLRLPSSVHIRGQKERCVLSDGYANFFSENAETGRRASGRKWCPDRLCSRKQHRPQPRCAVVRHRIGSGLQADGRREHERQTQHAVRACVLVMRVGRRGRIKGRQQPFFIGLCWLAAAAGASCGRHRLCSMDCVSVSCVAGAVAARTRTPESMATSNSSANAVTTTACRRRDWRMRSSMGAHYASQYLLAELHAASVCASARKVPVCRDGNSPEGLETEPATI